MSIKLFNNEENVTISSTKENFVITITESKEGEPLELVEITVHLLGRVWKGTIQDFAAIHSYGLNAFNLIAQYGGENIAELTELQQLLHNFGTTVAIPAPQDKYGTEIGVISSLMSQHFFDEIRTKLDEGTMAAHYKIAELAQDFYNTFKDFDWGKLEFKNGTKAQWEAEGIEDMVIAYTKNWLSSI